MADNINIRKLFLGQVGDNISPTSPVINGINVSDKNINAATTPAEALIQSMIGARQDFNPVTPEDYEKEFKRNQIDLTRISSQEELNRKRAENQGVGEQLFNALEQALVGEVLLGTAKGLTDIYDVAFNAIQEIKGAITDEEPLNDFTNEASKYLEDLKEKNRERFEIYEQNPDASWQMGDFGWWMNGATTVASTLSLLLPTTLITKTPSLIGKGLKMAKLAKAGDKATKVAKDVFGASKLSKSITKFGHNIGVISKPATRAKQLDLAANITANATIQRTLENWQEGREVYKATYDDALNRLTNMSDEDKATLLANNPHFEGKTNEEVAAYIADASANKTFINDYAMLLMDIPQFAGLNGLFRGLANKKATARLAIANKNAAKNLNKNVVPGVATGKVPEVSSAMKNVFEGVGDDALIKNNFINRLKYFAKNPYNVLTSLELSEGVEEGYQGIMNEKGKEVADLIFNPTTPKRTVESYLQDPEIWEQAFWGIFGGIGFQSLGKGLGHIQNKIQAKIDKSKMSEIDYAKAQLTDEKLREIEIAGRNDTFQKLITDFTLIDEGKNPYKKDKTGNDFAALEDGEAEVLKAEVVNNFLTKLTLDAVDAGNFDLLTEYVQASEFTKALKDAGVYDSVSAKLNNDFINIMEDIRENYQSTLHTALEYVKDDSPWVANILARNVARKKMTVNDLKSKIADIESELQVDTNYRNASERQYYLNVLKNIEDYKNQVVKAYEDKKISEQAYDAYIEEINEELEVFYNASYVHHQSALNTTDPTAKIQSIKEGFEEVKKRDPGAYEATAEVTPPKDQLDKLQQLHNTVWLTNKEEASIPTNNKGWKKAYDEIERSYTETAIAKYNNAVDKINEYIQNSDNISQALNDLYENNVSPELKEALDLVKIGYHKTADLWNKIQATALLEEIGRNRQREEDNKVIINGEVVSDPEVAAGVKDEVKEFMTDDVPSPTGEAPLSPPSSPAEVLPPDTDSEELAPDATPELEIVPDVPIQTDDFVPPPSISINQQYIEKVSSFILNNFIRRINNTVSDVNIYISDIIQRKDLNNESYEKLVKLIKEKIFSDGKITNENEQNKIIRNALYDFFDMRARAILSKDKGDKDATSELTLMNLLSDNNTLFSQFLTINVLPVEERATKLQQALNNYVKLKGKDKQKKVTIDLVDLFREIIKEKPTIKQHQLLSIYQAIAPYVNKGINVVKEGKEVKYLFTKKSKELIKNGFEAFMNGQVLTILKTNKEAKSTPGLRMALSSYNRNAQKLINDITSGKIANPNITVETHKNTLIIKHNDEELGYIPIVNKLVDEDGRVIYKNKNSTGALLVMTKDKYGSIISNFDDLLFEIALSAENYASGIIDEYTPLIELLNKYSANEEITDEDFKTLSQIPLIYDLIADGKAEYQDDDGTFTKINGGFIFKFKGGLNGLTFSQGSQAAREILGSLYKMLIDSHGELDLANTYEHFNAYKNYLYDSNVETYELQQKINRGEKVRINVIANKDNIVNNSETSHPIGTQIQGNEYQNYPIYRAENGVCVTEDGKQFKGDLAYDGRIGFIVQNGNVPLLSLFDAISLKESKSSIAEDVKKELKDIIEGFLNKKEGYSFDSIATKLTKLLSGAHDHKLFTNIQIIQSDGILSIKEYVNLEEQGRESARDLIIFNKYGSNESRKKASQAGARIIENPRVLVPNKTGGGRTQYTEYNENFAEEVAKEVISVLKFNLSDIGFTSEEIDEKKNPYFYKENGKIIVNIGGNKRVYENYAHFIYSENAAKTTAQKVNGSFYSYNPYARRNYGIPIEIVNSSDQIQQVTSTAQTLPELLDKAKEVNAEQIKTEDVLKSLGFDENTIKHCLGVVSQLPLMSTELSLMTEDIYKKHKKALGAYDPETDKIYINQEKLSNYNEKADIKSEVIRTLIHEQIHKLLTKSDETPLHKENFVKESLETFRLFKELIESKKDESDLNKSIYESNLYKEYLSKYEVKDGKLYKNNRKVNKENTDKFIQEWIAESLTQPALIQFNNKYEGVTEADLSKLESKPKTIFQRIIDAILKLYNAIARTFKENEVKIKNNTILAKQYLMLGAELKSDLTAPIMSEEKVEQLSLFDEQVIDKDNGTQPVEENDPLAPEVTEDEIENEDDEYYDDTSEFDAYEDDLMLSKFPTIDYQAESIEDSIMQSAIVNDNVITNGVIPTKSMTDFVQMFDEEDKLKIATMLSENEFNYLCQ